MEEYRRPSHEPEPERTLYIDLETRSSVDLPGAGVYRYSESMDFEVLLCSYAFDDEPVRVLVGEDAIRTDLRAALASRSVRKVAHNAQFERVCLSRVLGFDTGTYLDPGTWFCTQALAGVHGYPQKLSRLAPALGAQPKDEAGTRLINLFSKMQRGKWTRPEDKPAQWEEFIAYCRQDVETLRDIWHRIPGWPTEEERWVWLVDQYLNDRGIRLDLPLARAAQAAALANEETQKAELARLSGLPNPGNVKALAEVLGLPDVRKQTIAAALASEPVGTARRQMLELRQHLALSAPSRYGAALRCASEDGRLRGAFKYFGAHTGRWSGKGFQPQNLPRGFNNDVDAELAVMDLMAGLGASADDLKMLLRGVFDGPLTVVDFAAIEARVIAWLAGEEWALDAFRAGRDIYVETAERMGGLTRSQGKVAVLALGYQGSVGSLRALGYGGTQPGQAGYLEDKEILPLVVAWRKANRNIVEFWGDLDHAFVKGGPVGEFVAVERDGDTRRIVLPSGRAITYHGFRRRTIKKPGQEPKMASTFADPDGRLPFIQTYGGRLAENVTQAVARDLLAHALLTLYRQRVPVVAHIHDEVLVEGTEHSVAAVNKLITYAPAWAPGLPMGGAGFTCRRYRKD